MASQIFLFHKANLPQSSLSTVDTQFHLTVKEVKLFNGRNHDHDSQSQKENVSVS